MHDAGSRWLLLLGSSREDDSLMRRALEQLAKGGVAGWLTPIQRFAADDDSGLTFHNALASWQPTHGEADAHAQIRGIEAALGRDHDRSDEVAIDIDLLACFCNQQWHAHGHASDKGEFERPLVRMLLQQAGITVVHAGA